jgi:hypothetical protein
MDDRKYLMAEEVAQRYRGAASVGTLRNWRAMRVGPAFVKIGKAVLYPLMNSTLGIGETWCLAVRQNHWPRPSLIERNDHD